MTRRYSRKTKPSKIKDVIFAHLENNLKEYIIVGVTFLIGIVVGVIFINNTSESQSLEINNYISTFVQDLKDNKDINDLALLKDSIKKNLVLAVFIWFMGLTLIGISIIYICICFRGFCLGYTISSIIITLRNTEKEFYFQF